MVTCRWISLTLVCFGCAETPDPAFERGWDEQAVREGDEGPFLRLVWKEDGKSSMDRLGTSLATGDMNGDGFSDVAIGIPFFDGYNGRAQVHLGSASGVSRGFDWKAVGPPGDTVSTEFGTVLAGGGDANGDGFDDLAVGSGFAAEGGAAWLFLGNELAVRRNAAWSLRSIVDDERYGLSVAWAGDVNGDGFDELLVGAPLYDESASFDMWGRAYLYFGSAAGPSDVADWITEGVEKALVGTWLAGAGDVNGDGFDDVAIGASGGMTLWDGVPVKQFDGEARVYHGSPTGLGAVADWTVRDPEGAPGFFGSSGSGAGDVNGDGFDDLLVSTAGVAQNGVVYLFLGSANGLELTPAWSAQGDHWNDSFTVAAGVGDLNGDGFDDVAVGDPFAQVTLRNEGRVFVYLGSATGLGASPVRILDGGQKGAEFGGSLAGPTDVNGDGFHDLVVGVPSHDEKGNDAGRAYVYLGACLEDPDGDGVWDDC
jgi:hypothetical protein